jgi:hypothetical protein
MSRNTHRERFPCRPKAPDNPARKAPRRYPTTQHRGYTIEWRPERGAYEITHGAAHVAFRESVIKAHALINELADPFGAVHVCAQRDHECGSNPQHWCVHCPLHHRQPQPIGALALVVELAAALQPFVVHASSEITMTITVSTRAVERARAALAKVNRLLEPDDRKALGADTIGGLKE